MKCTKCGHELNTGELFCNHCGQDAQIVPTYDLFDDEIISNVGPKKKMSASKKKKAARKRNLAIIVAVFVLSTITVISIIIYTAYINSYSYHMKKAELAFNNSYLTEAVKEYKAAIVSTDKSSSSNSLYRSYLGLAKSQLMLADYDNAEININKAISLYPNSVDAYSVLLNIYSQTNNEKQINYLKATITDPSILKIVNSFYVGTPVFSKTPGDYEDDIKLFLSNTDGSKIYYTVNGSDPINNGFEYKGAILLAEGRTTVSAVCCNSNGLYGQVVSLTYNIKYPDPEYPTLIPDGGEYYEPQFIQIKVPSGCKAYYTWNNADPKEEGILYTDPILIEEGNNVLSVVVKNSKGRYSDIYRSNYKFYQ